MNIAITGANRGIGLALAQKYIKRGDKIYALCRESSKELEALNNITIIDGVEVNNQNLATTLQKKIDLKSLNIFINNAGIAIWDTYEDFDFNNLLQQFEVNALGPLNMVKQIKPFLAAKAKIGILTSRMGSLSDNTSGAYYGYRMSKAAANAMGKSLAHDLKSEGLAVALLHPGFVKTEMTDNKGDIEADEAAIGLINVIEKLDIHKTGKFWHSNGSELPW